MNAKRTGPVKISSKKIHRLITKEEKVSREKTGLLIEPIAAKGDAVHPNFNPNVCLTP
jgi:hypothetical protein